MSTYKLQDNEIEFILKTPTPESSTFISCILSKPEPEFHPETLRAAMLMHGLGGHKNTCYHSKLARKLSKEQGFYVVRFDFRNCGSSSKTGKIGRTLQNDIEDMNIVYNWLTSGGHENKKLFVDTLIGHSRGVVDVFNWQLTNKDKFVPNLVACAGRYIGSGLPNSIKRKHPNFEIEGGHYIKGFQDGKYGDVWIPLNETNSLGVLNMETVKEITKETNTLLIYGTRENVIPLEDAASYNNTLAGRNTLILIPGADHCFRGVDKIPENEWETCDKPIIKDLGIINYNSEVADKIANWMSMEEMNKRFYDKHVNVHEFLPRFKNIEGLFNFRDIGGYMNKNGNIVKYNQYFRSGNLSNITTKGVNALKKLGITKIFDLELSYKYRNIEKEIDLGIDVVKFQSIDNAEFLTTIESEIIKLLIRSAYDWSNISKLYIYMLEHLFPLFKITFESIYNHPNSKILFCCGLGKDSSGLFTMILLLLAGVEPLTVVQEYCLSVFGLEPVREDLTSLTISQIEEYSKVSEIRRDWSFERGGVANILNVKGSVVLSIISYLDTKYGGIEGYLQTAVGLSNECITKIKTNLII